MPELVAFIDESRKPERDLASGRPSGRGEHYVVAVAILMAEDVAAVGRSISDVERRLGYVVHYADLRSWSRRRAVIAELDRIPEWDGYLFETAQPLSARNHSEHHVRAKILEAAFRFLAADVGVSRIILETRAAPKHGFTLLDDKDHQVLQKLLTRKAVPANLQITHADKTERVLAIADVVAGARSDFLCRTGLEAYPLIGHRIRATRSLFAKVP